MRNILVATDLTGDSERALIRAIQLSKLSNAQLHVLHVAPGARLPTETEDTARLLAEIRDRVRAYVREYVPTDFGCEIYIECGGRVYDAIDHYARKVGADLVVIGRSIRPDVIPSSVLLTTSQVVVNACCPVLVVSRPVSGNYVHILLDTDLSISPQKILTPVRDFGPDIRLTLMSEARAKPEASMGFVQRLYARLRRRQCERFAARAADCLRERGLSADRMSIDRVDRDYDAVLLSKFNDKGVDVVGVRSMRLKLRRPDSASDLLAAVQTASCDILAMANV